MVVAAVSESPWIALAVALELASSRKAVMPTVLEPTAAIVLPVSL